MEEGIEVRLWNDQTGVYAAREFEPGERVMFVEGDISDVPSRYSIQIGTDLHIHPRTPHTSWMYLNHSCVPNLAYDGPSAFMVAIELIHPGDQLTFNYLTTEWEMAEVFDCACGYAGCFGRIAGYGHLGAADRERLAREVLAHLRRLELNGIPGASEEAFRAASETP